MDLLADSREVIRNDVSAEGLQGPWHPLCQCQAWGASAVRAGVDVLSCRAQGCACDPDWASCCWCSILPGVVACEKNSGVLLKPRFDFFSPPSVQGVLLLQQLTKSNAAIQKIVAFENAFERLLDIITEEGNSDGGTVQSKI